MTLLAEDFWRFSLQHYSKPEVKEACLLLQNHYQGNVNLALLLAWLDNQSLTIKDWQALLPALDTTNALLTSFRALRVQAKASANPLYQQMLSFELEIEQQQQAHLIHAVNQHELTTNSSPSLLERYCHSLNADILIAELSL
ncbi:TIGR02444 family protein [Aliivibrio kagoshimensis]|uniref:TIGR02444 family protein n=1 Tax=Aliivibrio kagoshimensis TaxID=2910230 RepID=UPI003D1316D5